MKRTILNLQWSTVLGVFLSVCTACGHKTGNGTGTTDSIPMAAAPEFNTVLSPIRLHNVRSGLAYRIRKPTVFAVRTLPRNSKVSVRPSPTNMQT